MSTTSLSQNRESSVSCTTSNATNRRKRITRVGIDRRTEQPARFLADEWAAENRPRARLKTARPSHHDRWTRQTLHVDAVRLASARRGGTATRSAARSNQPDQDRGKHA
jgi:hypothetical protein